MSNRNEQPRKDYGRWRYLSYPRFQWTMILANSLGIFLGFLGVFIVIRTFFRNMVQLGERVPLAPDHPYYQFLEVQIRSLGPQLWLCAGVALLVSSILSVWISHRAVGPIVKTIEYLKSIRSGGERGERTKLEFREDDLFKELPQLLNEVLVENSKKR